MAATQLQVREEELAAFCHRYGVARLLVFGSYLRPDFDPQRSDLDMLVEFQPGAHKGLFKLVEMQEALSRITGQSVDLVTPGSLSKYFRNTVMESAVVIYDAA
jgi:predicted nucleotidyltransferase